MFGIELRGKTLYRVLNVCCGMAFMMYGYDAGVLGGIQDTEPFLAAMGYPTGTYIIPMIASSYTLAATVSCMVVMVIGMRLGRRRCVLTGIGLVIVGGSFQASAWSVPQIIVARVLCGFGIGFISCTVPTYITEMSLLAGDRGPEVAIQTCMIITGIAIAYWLDFGTTRTNSQFSWRFPIAFQLVFATLSGIGILFLPDTPRWYYATGRNEQGDRVLTQLYELPLEHENVQRIKAEILTSVQLEEEEENKFNFLDLFWDRSNLRVGQRIRMAFLLQAFQNMMGVNLMVYYATIILANVGLSAFNVGIVAAVMQTFFALGTYPLPRTIERFGRRGILMWTAFTCGICLIVFVIMIGIPNPTKTTQWVAVASLFVCLFSFGYGWCGVPWIYAAETAPLKYRHIGGAACAMGEWSLAFVTVFGGGIALSDVGWKIWIWTILASFLVIPLVWFYCPETTGKSLEEIDLLYAKDVSQVVLDVLEHPTIKEHVEEIEDA